MSTQTQNFIDAAYGDQANYRLCITLGCCLMAISFTIVMSCIAINFIYESYFSLPIQIAGYIATIVFAALLKIGYVLRCVGAHSLGLEAY